MQPSSAPPSKTRSRPNLTAAPSRRSPTRPGCWPDRFRQKLFQPGSGDRGCEWPESWRFRSPKFEGQPPDWQPSSKLDWFRRASPCSGWLFEKEQMCFLLSGLNDYIKVKSVTVNLITDRFGTDTIYQMITISEYSVTYNMEVMSDWVLCLSPKYEQPTVFTYFLITLVYLYDFQKNSFKIRINFFSIIESYSFYYIS